jgi:hypothetical protein
LTRSHQDQVLRLIPSRPLPLLLLVTALFTFLIQSGELGTSDTTHRLQVTHSLWTSEPQVFPNEFPEAGLVGRGGRLYVQWGIGQSLLMLPTDLAGTALSHLPIWSNYVASQSDPAIRSIVVTITTNILINVLTALAAFHLLGLLGFSTRESIAGALALLCATTHLHYAQNMTENNYILLLTLTGFTLQLKWLLTGNRRALILGSAALGLNLLTRLPTALDILAAGCFLLLASLSAQHSQPSSLRSTATTYLRYAPPIYALFFFFDRLYQYIRFGSWTSTYMAVFASQQRQRDPTLPATFPFNGNWLHGGIYSGLFGPFISPQKSIFLFDPMILLALLLTALLWKRLTPTLRAFLATTFLLVAAYIAFHARFIWWPGDDAWGDRYISSAVELSTLLAVPLLLRYWQHLTRPIRYLAVLITAASVAIQCASLAFWVPLELYQSDTFGHDTCIILLRFKNIAALALGKREAWGLNTPTMFEDSWDAAHITTWNFLPSLLRHIGAAPLWAVHILYGIWFSVALALVVTLTRLFRILSHPATR